MMIVVMLLALISSLVSAQTTSIPKIYTVTVTGFDDTGFGNATLLMNKNYGLAPYTVTATVHSPNDASYCNLYVCVSRSYQGMTNTDIMNDHNGCKTVVAGALLAPGTHELAPFSLNSNGMMYLNVKMSEGCSGTVTLNGTECTEGSQFGPHCQFPASFPVFTDGQVVKAGQEATYIVALPEVGSFGSIMMSLVATGTINSTGTLSLTMDGFMTDGLNVGASSLVSLIGASSVAKVALVARRHHTYVFQVSNTGPDDITLSKVNYTLQNCNTGSNPNVGPDCSSVVPLIILQDGESYVYRPTEQMCVDGWCNFYVKMDCKPTISFSTNGSYPDVYFQTENTPTATNFDIFLETSPRLTYTPYASTRDYNGEDIIGVHRKDRNDMSEARLTFNCFSPLPPTPGPGPDYPGYDSGKTAGFIVLGVILVTAALVALLMFGKRREGYDPVQ